METQWDAFIQYNSIYQQTRTPYHIYYIMDFKTFKKIKLTKGYK